MNPKAIGSVQIQALARSARSQRYRQSGITRLGLVPQARDTYSVWPPPAPLTSELISACAERWLKFLLGRAQRGSPRWFTNKIKENTNKKQVRAS
jgi:hypothetical protein